MPLDLTYSGCEECGGSFCECFTKSKTAILARLGKPLFDRSDVSNASKSLNALML